ncbi:response regulator [Candidatus Methylomirabilis sp.]|uniref:response regulator n=1 Tax=Candidatus Methylomirabilis sp. TaxID=2032687 RepID=UPI0030765039
MTRDAILIVEDHEVSRELAVALLTAAGYTVLEAEDGRGLLDRVKRERPSLILMDLQLPHIDGFTLTRQLKADAETCQIPVLAATAYAQPEQEIKALEAGCVGYLTKPLDVQTLLKTVARLLDH